ncbi:MAG: ATP-dependent Clp protease ATP-binding subunit [Clostridia bacterium]|nr:ATP-dependent Clp protease ATP-binding subunit [Clostridia bacterium]
MQLCARCHKRPAVVFVTRMENNETKNEGLCLQCAKELGLPVDNILEKMGVNSDDIDSIGAELDSLIEQSDDNDEPSMGGDEENNAPAIDFKSLFGKISAELNGAKGKQQQNAGGQDQKDKKATKRKFLNDYCKDLTAAAREGRLDKIIGRERELRRMIQILMRRQKNNPCLIGEPGVGKTALADALAQLIVKKEVPYKLQDKEVFVLDLTALVAGTQFRGQFEGRMKGLIEEIKKEGNIILVIDEVHSIVGAGDAEGSMNAANILKPALSRGEIQVIGATTLGEYRKYIEKDSALERRFQPIVINEPSIDETVKIICGIKEYYEKYHGVIITEEIAEKAVRLSERYITDRFLPDKAIDLIDEAASYVAVNTPVVDKYAEKSDLLEKAKKAREALEALPEPEEEDKRRQRYEQLATLKSDEMRYQADLDSMKEQRNSVRLTVGDLARVIEIWTGIPTGNITEDEFERIKKLDEGLRRRIIGQDEAISAVVAAIKRKYAGVSVKRKPVSFIFAGPTGVGKTELVKQLASQLFDSPEALFRLDMSEYMEKHSVSKIIGSPPGYVGYDEAGQLTEKIRRKPYSVVLFDEIEKAHPDVLNILLQILDDGRITDAQGREVNFENTVIVMTTNAGSNFTTAPAGFGTDEKRVDETKTEKALTEFLRPEFINRIDEVITFNSLSSDDFRRIVRIMLSDLSAALAEKNTKFEYTDALCDYIVEKSYSKKFGARNMRRFIEKNVEDKVAELLINSLGKMPGKITADIENSEIIIKGES